MKASNLLGEMWSDVASRPCPQEELQEEFSQAGMLMWSGPIWPLTTEYKIERRLLESELFEFCVSAHVLLRMFITQVLVSQLPFLANRNAEMVVPPIFWLVNCIQIGRHIALLSGLTAYSI